MVTASPPGGAARCDTSGSWTKTEPDVAGKRSNRTPVELFGVGRRTLISGSSMPPLPVSRYPQWGKIIWYGTMPPNRRSMSTPGFLLSRHLLNASISAIANVIVENKISQIPIHIRLVDGPDRDA